MHGPGSYVLDGGTSLTSSATFLCGILSCTEIVQDCQGNSQTGEEDSASPVSSYPHAQPSPSPSRLSGSPGGVRIGPFTWSQSMSPPTSHDPVGAFFNRLVDSPKDVPRQRGFSGETSMFALLLCIRRTKERRYPIK
jgi:hypothetical protein